MKRRHDTSGILSSSSKRCVGEIILKDGLLQENMLKEKQQALEARERRNGEKNENGQQMGEEGDQENDDDPLSEYELCMSALFSNFIFLGDTEKSGTCWRWKMTTKFSNIARLWCLFFFLFTSPSSILSITGRDQTGYTVHAGFCMFPQSCDLRTETAGSL
jgi:hypothetical protein